MICMLKILNVMSCNILCGLLYVYRQKHVLISTPDTGEGTPILASALQTKHLIVFLRSQDRMQEAKIGGPVWVTEMQRN